jgi:hypothetical protein
MPTYKLLQKGNFDKMIILSVAQKLVFSVTQTLGDAQGDSKKISFAPAARN